MPRHTSFPWLAERELRVPAVLILAALAVGALAVVVALTQLSSTDRGAFWTEIGIAGLQLIVVAFGGGIITTALRSIEVQREQTQRRLELARERRREYSWYLLRHLRTAYNEIKRVRRDLELAGFRTCSGPLSGEQATAYAAGMSRLREVKFILEEIQEELEAGIGKDGSTRPIKELLDRLEHYVDDGLIDEYRDWASTLKAAPESVECQRLKLLLAFVADSRVAFAGNVSRPYHRLSGLLRVLILSDESGTSPVNASSSR